MLGFLRRHLHRQVRHSIHRSWMQWSIRLYEGVTTFVHGLLWITGLLFLSGHIAATAVQAGYHLSNVCRMPTRSSRSISGIWVGKNYSRSHPFLRAFWPSIACTRRMSGGACGRITAITAMAL
jgi:hypothetical protein